MVPVLGRYAGLLTVALLGLVVFGPLAVFLPLWSALTLGAAAAAGSGLALSRIAALKARCEKLSGEVDLLSRRLLKVETGAAQPRPETGEPALRAQIEELTVEFGLLSGIVRDLTNVVSTQDAEIAGLKARPEPAPAPPAAIPALVAAAPVAAPVPTAAAPLSDWTQAAPPPRSPLPPAAAAVPPRPIPPQPVSVRPIPPPRPAQDPEREADIIRAFEGDGLEIHLQPVVSLPQRKVVAYEALARLRIEGRDPAAAAEPDAFLPVLERQGRTTELDRRMLQRAAVVVRHLARRGSDTLLTYGLSPLSLFEPSLLRDLGRMVVEDPALAGLVIALPQASWRSLDAGQRGLLAPMRGRIGFSLDRPDDLRFDPLELAALGIGQVKVPAEMLLRPEEASRSLSDIAVEDTAAALARAGIRLVATGISDEADIPDLIDLDVAFAQGAAFAAPRPVRAEVLTALPPEAPPPPTEPGPERRSFRSVLRRAV
ncbi:cyclic-di-GMP phosphodiesterase, flagellum assembly factor TipF [Methylobacterium phyllostachyos]|uniref:Cyclic-di-GMP phosphodiesterase, flagellum assembly factor TipF n=1 Tax=Methylobacterium phyllostachyos TaxID=582672 RepID=A0A1H0AKX8_9HYPH|nr:EAL domain-containing protein [Methylobacterium phyllostachyos]SDN34242.1 cyclic-di-GMP phosphodiesterase, flagellum assembly factor TipF [Methylobacterium phyllostachyos]